MDIFDAISKAAKDKKEWQAQMARVKALPKDYQIVFKEVEKYLWQFSDQNEATSFNEIYQLIDFFEEGAASQLPVLEFIGTDVGSFAEKYAQELQTKK